MTDLLSAFGETSLKEFSNKRFKSRNEIEAEAVSEYLFLLKKAS
jgi:hypothetical protein